MKNLNLKQAAWILSTVMVLSLFQNCAPAGGDYEGDYLAYEASSEGTEIDTSGTGSVTPQTPAPAAPVAAPAPVYAGKWVLATDAGMIGPAGISGACGSLSGFAEGAGCNSLGQACLREGTRSFYVCR